MGKSFVSFFWLTVYICLIAFANVRKRSCQQYSYDILSENCRLGIYCIHIISFLLLKTQYKSCTITENILSTKWFDLTRSNTARLFCGVCDGQIAPASSRTAFPFSNLSVGLWTLSQQWCHHSLVSNFANYWPVFNFSPPDTHYMAWHRLLAMHVGLGPQLLRGRHFSAGISEGRRIVGRTPQLHTRAFQFAIRIDSIRYANRFESIRLVKKIGISIH